MAKAYVFLTKGFEETEAVTTIDILRRAEIETVIVSIGDDKTVTGGHNVAVAADKTLTEARDELGAASVETALILPGGKVVPGYTASETLSAVITAHAKRRGLVAAICIAPTYLAELGVLKDATAVCYPTGESVLTAAGVKLGRKDVCVNGSFITSRGPGTTPRFALTIVKKLVGVDKASEIARDFLL